MAIGLAPVFDTGPYAASPPAGTPETVELVLGHLGPALIQLDPGIANGKAREATLARFALIAQGKVRPSEDGRYKSS